MKTFFKILMSLILLFLLIFVGGIFYLSRGLNEVMSISLNGIDISKLDDGKYTGEYDHGRWTNKLDITVKNNKITEILIKDDVTFSKPSVSDELFNKVIETQSTKIDAISGATVTSKAYLKSIENVLNKK
ncbi:FMN-binding protein [Clostridium perfringens]|uniref:FMN-binding protein n=1 Tax=Clostridium perfringens TaxID=1502 RepID=UPI002ACC0B42|nr:FMN-binding protein [Clostridium perfringens]